MNRVAEHNSEDFHYALCLSEINNSILMWSHYGRGHAGVVLEIDTSVSNKDFYRSTILKVEYDDELPKFFEQKFVRYYMTGEISFDMYDIFNRSRCIKSKAWEYEKEWRIVSGLYPNGELLRGQLRAEWPFFAENITGIYIGCKVTDEVREEIIGISHLDFGHLANPRGKSTT
jgi:hypothetical protein